MANYLRFTLDRDQTPQIEPIPSRSQVENNAGGYVFQMDDWGRLERWMILGSEGGTYYASERKLTKENAECALRCVRAEGPRAVLMARDISRSGRAPKNDPALFLLALAISFGDNDTKNLVADVLQQVARTGTHLLHFVQYAQSMRGWGRTLRDAVAGWYTNMPADMLAYQLIKYQSRDGWAHRDVLRLSHARPSQVGDERGIAIQIGTRIPRKKNAPDYSTVAPTKLYKLKEPYSSLLHWATHGWQSVGTEPHPDPVLRKVWAFERAKRSTDEAEICRLIRDYDLPRECIPTQMLNLPGVWEALLERMPMTAMVRNLATMTRVGLIKPLSNATNTVAQILHDQDRMRKSRLHPVAVLSALVTYTQGHGVRGNAHWDAVPQISDALNDAFYMAFGNVQSTGKRIMLALDISSSMNSGQIAGMPLTPRTASCAMAMVTSAVEPYHTVVGFCTTGSQSGLDRHSNVIKPLDVSSRKRLDDVVRYADNLPFGGTDCALPMLYAIDNKLPVDSFVIYTDSETWAGAIHPTQALKMYRDRMDIPAKLIVVGMTATEFTIADPQDAGQLDVVGFDTAAPSLISDFMVGGIKGQAIDGMQDENGVPVETEASSI